MQQKIKERGDTEPNHPASKSKRSPPNLLCC